MELTDELKSVFIETAKTLKGSTLRIFIARVIKALGCGGSHQAEKELSWNRGTIRKGLHELESGITCLDAYSARGRKRTEDHLPELLADIRSIADRQSQTGPQFQDHASLHPLECESSIAAIDQTKRLHRRRFAYNSHGVHQTGSIELPSM